MRICADLWIKFFLTGFTGLTGLGFSWSFELEWESGLYTILFSNSNSKLELTPFLELELLLVVKLLSLIGDLESWSFGGVPILLRNKRCSLAQQTMLRCATKGWVVAQGGWRGIVSSKERSAHLSREKCVPVVKLLFNCSSKFKI